VSAESTGASVHPQWSALLDELESQLDDAERTLTSAASVTAAPDDATSPPAAPRPWAPPTGLGPLPAALSDRASSVLARQAVLVARLVEARSAVQQQLGAVRRVEASHEPGRPVYLDALG
jgi:hypothetical protein